MNNKGFSGAALYIFLGLVVSMVTASAMLRPSHIVRKSMEKCIKDGGTNCEATVGAMDQDQRLDYIEDKLLPGQPTQNFTHR